MSKILKNTTVSPITISDTGVTIPASPGQYTIPPQDYLLWAASSDIVGPVGVGDITVNDGSNDLNASDGMDLIKGLFPNPVGVASGDDRTPIGHVNDSLKVDALANYPNGIPIDQSPQGFIRPRFDNLLNGTSKDMIVDGSVTPVEFKWEPPGTVHVVKHLNIVLGCPNDTDSDEFGGGTALTNGIDFRIKSNGTIFDMYNVKNNKDLTLFFSVGNFQVGNTDSKWLKDAGGRYFIGTIELSDGVRLDPATGDYIEIIIRDDLTAASRCIFFEAGVFSWRDS